MNYLEMSSYRNDPSVTILLGMPNNEKNAEKYSLVLKNLVKEATKELANKNKLTEEIKEKLAVILQEFKSTHKKGSIIYFVSDSVVERIDLPFVIESTYYIDSFFHTKEILRHENRPNHYYVLTVGAEVSRLLEFVDDTFIQEIKDGHFPVANKGYWTRDRLLNSMGSVNTNYRKEFFKWVDSELQVHLNRKPHPLILAGTIENTSMYRQIANQRDVIVGEIRGDFSNHLDKEQMGTAANEVTTAYIQEQKRTLRNEMSRFENKGRLEKDLANIYMQAIRGKGQKLILDQDFYQEAVIEDHGVRMVDIDANEEGYVEDLVNEIIFEVMRYGGEVVFADPALLAENESILLQLRY